MSLASIFATAILPIVAIAAAGFFLGKRTDVDAGPLNTVTVYVLVPALVFHSLATTTLGVSMLAAVGLGVLLFSGVMVAIAEGVGRSLGETEPILGSFVLVSTFSNAGNYGIPLSEFAFGAVGRSTAVVYIVAQSVVMYTLGVYLAARGDGTEIREGLRTVFSIPLVYTVVAALFVKGVGLVPAETTAAMETLKLVGDSAIPVMLVILGIELADTTYGSALVRVAPATVLKMVVAPVVAVGVVLALAGVFPAGFRDPTVGRVFVLECATPAAVTTLILTGEFAGGTDLEDAITASEFTSTAILVTTLVSIPLITGLIALLRTGIVV